MMKESSGDPIPRGEEIHHSAEGIHHSADGIHPSGDLILLTGVLILLSEDQIRAGPGVV